MTFASQSIILKILSGPMYGMDIALPKEKLVCIHFANTDALNQLDINNSHNHAVINAQNSVFIPSTESVSEKFVLRFTRDNTDEQNALSVTAQQLDSSDEPNEEAGIAVPLNIPVTIGNAVIAIKEAGSDWSDEVFHYNYVSPDAMQSVASVSETARTKTARGWLSFTTLILLSAIIAATCGAAYLWLRTDETIVLSQALREISPEITQTSDGKHYIVTQTDAQRLWVSNALKKQNMLTNDIQITSQEAIRRDLEDTLRNAHVSFFTIQFSSPLALRLLVSRERWPDTVANNQVIATLFKQKYSWISKFSVERVSDVQLRQKATATLRSLGLKSSEDVSRDRINFIVWDDIPDNYLSTVHRQISDFYHQFGDEYIKFIVNLNEDPLRNRSFRIGNDGYIIEPGNHWLYTDITTTNHQP